MATALLHSPFRLSAASPHDGDGPPVTTPRTPAREAAERELSKRGYHEGDPGLLRRFLEWLWDHVSSLLSAAAQAAPGGWAGLTVLACAVLLLVVAVRMRLGRLRPGPTSDSGTLFGDRPRSAAEHRAAAEAHAAEDHWSEALQERMRAVVRSLEERALLDRRPSRTADEAASEAGRMLPGQSDALRSAARSFDEVTYAGRPADAAAYRSISDLDSALQHAVPRLHGTTALPATGTDAHRDHADRETAAFAPDGGGR